MASYGSGFSSGLFAGSAVAKRGMDNYNKRIEDEATTALFNSAMGVDAEGQAIAQEGEERANIMDMFENASMGDITNTIVDNFVAGGGKINDQTYKLATGVASTLFGVKEKEKEYQQKNSLFGLKKEQLNAQISRLGRMNIGKDDGETTAPYQLTEDGKIDPTSVDMGSQWYKNQPKDIKRGIANAQGFKSIPSPATLYDTGDDYNIEDDVAEPKTETKTKKKSWKDYIN